MGEQAKHKKKSEKKILDFVPGMFLYKVTISEREHLNILYGIVMFS